MCNLKYPLCNTHATPFPDDRLWILLYRLEDICNKQIVVGPVASVAGDSAGR